MGGIKAHLPVDISQQYKQVEIAGGDQSERQMDDVGAGYLSKTDRPSLPLDIGRKKANIVWMFAYFIPRVVKSAVPSSVE
jgi:hypothetical protein